MKKVVVLIVENEALIRMDAIQIVEDAGFGVVEACDADEAIRILHKRSDIRAVFTDITMAGSMDGLKLAHVVRDRWPSIHLIVTSGRNALNERELPQNARFIRKPYKGEQVITVLRELFGHNCNTPACDNTYHHGVA